MGTLITEKPEVIEWGMAARPLTGQPVSGDAYVVQCFADGALVAAIDGVGHGDEARAAAQRAAGILKQNAEESVITLIKLCHEALAKTRGVVITLASVSAVNDTVTWLGVGNVEARLFRRHADISHPCEYILLRAGLIGLQLPALQASIMPLNQGDLLVFATDGIGTGFGEGMNLTAPVQQIADGILNRHSKGTDDALTLTVRYTGLAS
jgi:hypothetical protein